MSAPPDLRERVRALPGVGQLLPALGDLPPVYLVGGAVRVLIGIDEQLPSIDLAVEGDARQAARTIAARLGGDAREYEQFGTATVRTPRLEFDLATTRRETYPEPGALPRVEHAPLAEDLARRDFAVNAMAVGLRGDDLGHLYDPLGGVSDAESRVIRVLHEGSFLDDPTRLLRGVRFETRLGFSMDEETERAARDAVAAGALDTVSGARIRDELLDLLAELEAPSAVARLGDLGIDAGLHPALRPDPELVASAALGAVAIEADRALAALAALCAAAPQELDLWLAGLQLDARDRDVVSRAARTARPLAAELRSRDHAPSELRAVLAGEPRELLALALASGAPPEPILRWLSDLSRVHLEISGSDLLEAGVPEGPALRRGAGRDARPEARRGAGRPRGGARGGAGPGAGRLMPELALPGARVLFTDRNGGVSEGPYRSLNLGVLTDDDPQRVLENRRRAATALRVEPERVAMGWQVHGTELATWHGPPADPGYARPGAGLQRVDGHVTAVPGLALLVLAADCYPVALSDGERVAMVHCGWRGLAGGIVERAVGALARQVAAAVGPGIGACCYEVGPEVRAAFADVPDAAQGRMLDLRAIVGHKLAAAGVSDVQHVEHCTSCRADLYFSHRRDDGLTGRQGGLVALDA